MKKKLFTKRFSYTIIKKKGVKNLSFFGRLRNIVRSNINYNKESSYTNFEDFAPEEDFESEFKEYTETPQKQEYHDIEREYRAILEVGYNADFDEIKKSYRKLLKKYHPDLYHNKPEKFEKAQKLTEKINQAYSYFENKYN